MTTLTVHEARSIDHPSLPALPDLVEAIGSDRFGSTVVSFLHELCGADHFAAFRMGNGVLQQVTVGSLDPNHSARHFVDSYIGQEWWRRDPAMSEAEQSLSSDASNIIHVDMGDRHYADMRPVIFPTVRDRLLVCARRHDVAFGMSVIRTDPNPQFDAGSVEQLAGASDVLMAMLAKHADITAQRPNVALALTSLDEIEQCIVVMSQLPRREVEVCSRILYGLSSVGIALDLGVGEESVKTYRKRAYQRLHIGSERELLTWYLSQWSAWRGHYFQLAAAKEPGRFGPH
jgi:DNA-binding CsgD family transcriptional regulator